MTDNNEEYFKRRCNYVCIDSREDYMFSLDKSSKISSDVNIYNFEDGEKGAIKEINN